MNKKINFKLGFLNVSFVAIAFTLLFIGVSNYLSILEFSEKEAGNEASGIAISIAKSIGAEKFAGVIKNGKSDSYYEELRVRLNNTLKETGAKYLTTVIIKEDKLNFIVDGSDPNSEDFSEYMDTDEFGNDELKDLFTSGKNGYTSMFKDPIWGYLLSAVAPIKDSNGTIIAFVEADISVSAIKAKINMFTIKLAISLGFALLVAFVMILFIKQNITKPIEKFVESFHKLNEGDFSSKVEFSKKGIFELLKNEYNSLIQKIASIISDIKKEMANIDKEKDNLLFDMDNIVKGKTSDYYKESSSQMENGIEQQIVFIKEMVDEIFKQSASTQNALASLEEMAASVKEIANYVKQTKDSSENAMVIAENSYNNVTELNESMTDINSSMQGVNEKIEELMSYSDNIGGIVGSIQSISQRTNLLALNAAIEAARAGEAGKGFSVVADEIRKLAEQTNGETKKISEIVTNIRNEILEVKDANNIVDEKIKIGNDITTRVKEDINSIMNITNTNNNYIGNITSSTAEQSNAIHDITKNIEYITEKADDIEVLGNRVEEITKAIESVIYKKLDSLYEIKVNLDAVKKDIEFFK